LKLKIFFICICIYSFSIHAINIRVVDLDYLIEKNKVFMNFFSEIEDDQIIFKNKFIEKELLLQSELKRIDELKLILENSELEKEINIYNLSLKDFNTEVNKFNIHYESQINEVKSKILQNILKILKKHSLENKIDLILDSNNYILSSNSINITDLILNELNEINFDINFEKFK
jgi:Skp family chaperone for outer membrane proteins